MHLEERALLHLTDGGQTWHLAYETHKGNPFSFEGAPGPTGRMNDDMFLGTIAFMDACEPLGSYYIHRMLNQKQDAVLKAVRQTNDVRATASATS